MISENSSTPAKDGFIYVITTSYLQPINVFNIGYTKNLKQILDTFNAYRYSCEPQYYVVTTYATADARALESVIHRKLIDYHEEGDYFNCRIETIEEAFEVEESIEKVQKDGVNKKQ